MPDKTSVNWRTIIIVAETGRYDEDINPRFSRPYGVPAIVVGHTLLVAGVVIDLWLPIAALPYIVVSIVVQKPGRPLENGCPASV